jgi:hypothetical protein
MKLSEVKTALQTTGEVRFKLPNSNPVPSHFHITEVGHISKHFIDCGGTVRIEHRVGFQLWEADDFEHRLSPQKLLSIIQLSEDKLQLGDFEVEVEYQSDTIGKFGLSFDGEAFVLVNLQTDCLAKDNCGIPTTKPKVKLSSIGQNNACTPGGGCC